MFVGMLGHDLRNPLNAVIMTARLLQRRAPAEGRAVARILSSAQRMATMVAQLLDLTRSRLAGGITIERSEVDVAAAVGEVIDELRGTHPDRQVDWSGPAHLTAAVDAGRLGQVVSNLVGNALEHGDPSAPVTVRLFAPGEGEDLVLTVHNAGPPIPPDLLPTLFDPFRGTKSRGERSHGLGLGLFITEQLVLAHGGQLDVRSTHDEGTTFTVRLPRWAPQHLALPDPSLLG
jgi:signal transduction histidine kinase